MYYYTLNIGLENNPLTAYQIEQLINFTINSNGRIYTRQTTGEYNSEAEHTLIVMIAGTTFDRYYIQSFVQLLCTICTQECIPVHSPGYYRELIYNANFEGEKFTFDIQYFINY